MVGNSSPLGGQAPFQSLTNLVSPFKSGSLANIVTQIIECRPDSELSLQSGASARLS
jgi:hypothetical protein